MRFESPLFLLLLLCAPFVCDRIILQRLRKRFWPSSANVSEQFGIGFSSPLASTVFGQLLQEHAGRSRYAPTLLSVLRVIGFVFLVIALARPQHGVSFREVEMSGRDLMLALDVSGSMQAMDFIIDKKRVDRLTALKSVTEKFVERRAGDRLGLVIFGDQVFTQCPLTTDHGLLTEYLSQMQIGMAGNGTAIGDALGIALKRVENIKENSKAIILITDGRSNSGVLLPLDVARVAAERKIRVYTIGIGGPEPAPFPKKDIFGIPRLALMESDYDEETLKKIAELTGGKYFNAKNVSGLEEVYKEIDMLEERKDTSFEHIDYEEMFLPWLLLGVSSLLVAQLLSTTLLRQTD